MFATLCMAIIIVQVPAAEAAKTPEKDIPIDLIVNGSYIKTDAAPFIEYDTTLVPIRFVSEALGATVWWDESAAEAVVVDGGKTIRMPENKSVAYVNGKAVKLAKPMRLQGGRTFVPVRFVAESLGAKVGWDQQYFNVTISRGSLGVPSHLIKRDYTTDDIFWLGRIIEAESAGEPVAGMVGVGNAILNRVKSKEYPNTIYGVIFDRKHGVQYEPILNGTIYNNPSSDSIASAKRALRGENFVGSSLFFFNPRIAQSNWISLNRTYYTSIGNHDFYL